MIIAGIDYSMTSPAICIHEGTVWDISNCKFFYVVQTDKFLIVTDQMRGTLYPSWNTQEQRFENLANWSLNILNEFHVTELSLEGYAMGAKGQVFSIGENTGVLKNKMMKSRIKFDVPPPTVIKKFATGKGNANKEMMWDFFLEETKFNFFQKLGQEEKKNWNPVSDLVDSYFLAKYRFESGTLPLS